MSKSKEQPAETAPEPLYPAIEDFVGTASAEEVNDLFKSLKDGLGKVKGKIFRIGHLGDFNDLMLAGTLAGIEMGLSLVGIPFKKGGAAAANGKKIKAAIERTEELLSYLLQVREKIQAERGKSR